MWPFSSRKSQEVAQLRESVRLLKLEGEAREHRHKQSIHQLREAFPNGFSPSYPGFGQQINQMQAFFDGLTPLFAPVPAYWDYTLNLGYYVTEAYLDLLRMTARYWYATQPQAQGVILGLRDYVIHTGFEYQVLSKTETKKADGLAKKAQKIIDEFMCKNRWFERELDSYVRLHRDGDVVTRLFPNDDGITRVRTVEPWQVRAPGNPDPDWLYGVHTAAGDREEILGYYITMTGTLGDGEEIDAAEISFLKNGTDFAVKRGVSDFLATEALWEQSRKLLSCALTGESVRQAVAWIEQFSGATQAAVESLAQTLTAMGQGATPTVGTPPAAPPQAIDAGTIPRIDQSQEMKNPPTGNTENATRMLTAAYQALSVYYRIPEWMVSGFSDANFAQALVQESPLVRRCQTEQKLIKGVNAETLMKVLRIAEEQQLLPQGACDDLEINVEATPLVVRDALKETERNEKLYNAGRLSGRTWDTREELDTDAEQEQRKQDGDPPPQAQQAEPAAGDSATPGAAYKRLTGANGNGTN